MLIELDVLWAYAKTVHIERYTYAKFNQLYVNPMAK